MADRLTMQDPREQYPRPPFPRQPQPVPGLAKQMKGVTPKDGALFALGGVSWEN